jgi:hypothetical protein
MGGEWRRVGQVMYVCCRYAVGDKKSKNIGSQERKARLRVGGGRVCALLGAVFQGLHGPVEKSYAESYEGGFL